MYLPKTFRVCFHLVFPWKQNIFIAIWVWLHVFQESRLVFPNLCYCAAKITSKVMGGDQFVSESNKWPLHGFSFENWTKFLSRPTNHPVTSLPISHTYFNFINVLKNVQFAFEKTLIQQRIVNRFLTVKICIMVIEKHAIDACLPYPLLN